jgi:hypothetical protein
MSGAVMAGLACVSVVADEGAVNEAPAAMRLFEEKMADFPGLRTCGGEMLGKYSGEDCLFRMVNGVGDAAEGREGLQAVFTWEQKGCAYITFGSDLNPDVRDISAYQFLKFSVKRVAASSSPLYLKLQMKDAAGGVGEVALVPEMAYGNVPCDGAYHEVSVPLADFTPAVDLTKVTRPFMAVTDQGAVNYPVWFDGIRLER